MAQTEQENKAKRRPGIIKRFLGIFGIEFPEERGRWILLTRRFRLLVLLSFLLVVGVACWFLFYYSKKPEFCESCHYVRPYVASWRESSHNMVACNECHFPPGFKNYLRAKMATTVELVKTITATEGPMPYAEVEDEACLRGGCHETRLLEDEVLLFKGKYKFDHKPHLTQLRRGKKLRCTSCHSQIVQGEHIKVTESVCFTCHFKSLIHGREEHPIAGCTACHEPPAEPIKVTDDLSFNHKSYLDRGVACWKCHFDSVQGNGEVSKQVCRTCHSEPEKIEKYSDSEFMHDWHVTKRKVECFQCHSEIRHGLHPEPYEQEASCGVCHSAGHSVQKELYAGRGGKGVPDHPSTMFRTNVDCLACHEVPTFEYDQHLTDMATYEATEKGCVECHGSAMKDTLADWQEIITETLSDAAASLNKARQTYESLADDHPQKAKAKELLDTAQHNYDFVVKARGVHNLEYALELLDKVMADAAEVIGIGREAAKTAASLEQSQ